MSLESVYYLKLYLSMKLNHKKVGGLIKYI